MKYLKGYLASIVAHTTGAPISGLDMETIYAIALHRKFEDHECLQYLRAKGYVQRGALSLTKKGEVVLQKAKDNYEEKLKMITLDVGLYSLAAASGTFGNEK